MREHAVLPRSERGAPAIDRTLAAWDAMFLGTIDPSRERRMGAVLGALDRRFRHPVRVLELGTGPGSLTRRILARIPGSRVIGVDSDPVLLKVGERALTQYGGRVAWVLADLREEGWSDGLPSVAFDAVVSSLALHWLEEDEVSAVYRDVHGLLRPGGLLVNGDFLPSERAERNARLRTSSVARDRSARIADARVRDFRRLWGRWWGALAHERALAPAFHERQTWMPGAIPPRRTSGPAAPARLEFHQRALRRLGYRATATVWHEHGFRVLVATR